MAEDVELAARVRTVLAGQGCGWTEKQMFGALGFMIGGHLALSASNRGGLMLRVDSARVETLLNDPRVSPFEMRGRPMPGWLHAAVDAEVPEPDLVRWVEQSVGWAKTLPSKGNGA